MSLIGLKSSIHLLTFSIGFGGSFFYLYIASPLAFKYLERSQFSILQNHVFPIYFLGQTLIPSVLGLTSTIPLTNLSISMLVLSTVSSGMNYFWLMPKCRTIKEERNYLINNNLDKVDGVETEDFKQKTKQFGIYHGISLLCNLLSVGSLAVYGLTFA